MAEDNSYLSSSDSDEEFLTVEKQQDREAIVRKKLLENFYGKSAFQQARPRSMDSEDEDDLNVEPSRRATITNLDSPDFDTLAHTFKHVTTDSVHELLEQEEQLALQVRTLESTMQTLVYENYTRFIDATDAIHSIGTNVQANEAGLVRLKEGVKAIDETSKAVEDALGTLRDQVAEKIRVQRLLTRLDSLLRLPQTLQEQIASGRYKSATKSYLQASSILARHSSEGLESLENIQADCTKILVSMKQDIVRKMMHWSGQLSEFDDEGVNTPDHPRSMAEIFECVSALLLILSQDNNELLQSSSEEEKPTEMSTDELQSMSTSAAIRLLDRILDMHAIEIQERRFAAEGAGLELHQQLAGVPGIDVAPLSLRDRTQSGEQLVAKEFLSALMRAASLFASLFPGDNVDAKTTLLEFVSEAFSSFLVHTKTVLADESALAANQEDAAQSSDEVAEEASGYADVSGALLLLVQSVQEVATGLSVPEIGLSRDYTFTMVDQVAELTQSMIRRRVDHKFRRLRQSIIEECLIPFVTKAASEKDGNDFLADTIQSAKNTLSNCLQLMDDTVRSILEGDMASGGGGDTASDLKDAVFSSTRTFSYWLADSFEILAGGESSERRRLAEAPIEKIDGDDDDDEAMTSPRSAIDLSADDTAAGLLDDAFDELIKNLSPLCGSDDTNTDFVLAVASLCRAAQSSVPTSLDQSVTAHVGGASGSRKTARGLFSTDDNTSPSKAHGGRDDIGARFVTAEARIVTIYATSRGSQVAQSLCLNMEELSGPSAEKKSPVGPSDLVVEALSVVKATAIDIAHVFNESKRAGPVKLFEDDRQSGLFNPMMGRKTGLQLDVERMFKEKVMIYPHPSESRITTRDTALFVVLKTGFRSMFEQARLLTFMPSAFQQLLVDTELLKNLVSHFVSDSTDAHGTLINLLSEVTDIVGDRCPGHDSVELTELYVSESVERVKSFITNGDSVLTRRFIIDDEE